MRCKRKTKQKAKDHTMSKNGMCTGKVKDKKVNIHKKNRQHYISQIITEILKHLFLDKWNIAKT